MTKEPQNVLICYRYKKKIGVLNMNNVRNLLMVLLLVTMLAGCGSSESAKRTETTKKTEAAQSTELRNSGNDAAGGVAEDQGKQVEISESDKFLPYNEFGLEYNADSKELLFDGELVRCFDDTYYIDEEIAGVTFFNEKGKVDVQAVHDIKANHKEDGSIDPAGKLFGLKKLSKEEFDGRDVSALNAKIQTIAEAGNPLSSQEKKEIYEEYKDFGVTYDADKDEVSYNGKKVRYLIDVMSSNGKNLKEGDFKGSVRNFSCGDGEIDIYTERDYSKLDTQGNGTLQNVKACTQEEFDANTVEYNIDWKGKAN